MPTPPPHPVLPQGYRCDPASLDDAPAIHAVIDACERSMHGRSQTDLSHVVADLTRHSTEGYVDHVAVRADHRGRGIAKALLLTAFRGFHLRGRSTTTLWTHSKTGALGLYEGIGMTVRRSDTVYHGKLSAS